MGETYAHVRETPSLRNVGPITELTIEPRFLENGSPVPIIIVGQNGAGKSLALSAGIDGMTEIRRQVFSRLLEVSETNYLKLLTRKYIRHGQPFSLSEFVITDGANDVTFREIVSAHDGRFLQQNHSDIAALALAAGQQNFLDNGTSKYAIVPQNLHKGTVSRAALRGRGGGVKSVTTTNTGRNRPTSMRPAEPSQGLPGRQGRSGNSVGPEVSRMAEPMQAML